MSDVTTRIVVDLDEVDEAIRRTERLERELNDVDAREAGGSARGDVDARGAAAAGAAARASGIGALGPALAGYVTIEAAEGLFDQAIEAWSQGGDLEQIVERFVLNLTDALVSKIIESIPFAQQVERLFGEIQRRERVKNEAEAASLRERQDLKARLKDDPRERAAVAAVFGRVAEQELAEEAERFASGGGIPGGF